MTDEQLATVRYLVTDVDAATDFYLTHLGFTEQMRVPGAFADVRRGALRLLLSGPSSSGAKATPADYARPGANRIHLPCPDLDAEIERLEEAGVYLVSDVVSGPGGRQALLTDPEGNLVELFEPGGTRFR